jgi:hypothetical protein
MEIILGLVIGIAGLMAIDFINGVIEELWIK